jgi:hypothetical protein
MQSESLISLHPMWTPGLARLNAGNCQVALDKMPDRRFQSARELRSAFVIVRNAEVSLATASAPPSSSSSSSSSFSSSSSSAAAVHSGAPTSAAGVTEALAMSLPVTPAVAATDASRLVNGEPTQASLLLQLLQLQQLLQQPRTPGSESLASLLAARSGASGEAATAGKLAATQREQLQQLLQVALLQIPQEASQPQLQPQQELQPQLQPQPGPELLAVADAQPAHVPVVAVIEAPATERAAAFIVPEKGECDGAGEGVDAGLLIGGCSTNSVVGGIRRSDSNASLFSSFFPNLSASAASIALPGDVDAAANVAARDFDFGLDFWSNHSDDSIGSLDLFR